MLKTNSIAAVTVRAATIAFAVLLMASSISPGVAASPSFACTGSLLPTEAVVCSDDTLSALDRALTSAYQNKLDSLPAGQKGQFESAEKTWLANRNGCGTDKACINKSYLARISVVSGEPSAAAGGPSCKDSVGAAQAATYVKQCSEVSPATHPPCNAANACALIISEIRRGCAFIGAGAPVFCAAYK